jgi:hypothetical protein
MASPQPTEAMMAEVTKSMESETWRVGGNILLSLAHAEASEGVRVTLVNLRPAPVRKATAREFFGWCVNTLFNQRFRLDFTGEEAAVDKTLSTIDYTMRRFGHGCPV